MTLAILIILMAVFSSVFRSLTPWAKQYKGEVEQHLSMLLGQPVTIQTMETGWYWFQPVLKLKQVTLGDDSRNAFHLNKLLVGINVFKSIWNWQIQPGVLYIDDMHLTFREKKGHWTIDGISTDTINSEDMTPEKTKQILIWLSQQERLIIKRVSAYFYFSDGGLIPVDGLNISVLNNGGHYKFKGNARLEQTNSTDFQLLGDGYFDPEHFENIEGKFYFSAQNIVPAQWQSLFSKAAEHLEGGKGDLRLWMDVHQGRVSSIQAQIKLEHLAWRLLNTEHGQLIQSFFANLSWQPEKTGWQLHGDQIQLRVGGVNWPENQILIKYNQEQLTYQVFVKTIIIESILSEAINWPSSIQALLLLKPEGILQDTQILIKAPDNSFRLPSVPQFPSAMADAGEAPAKHVPEDANTAEQKHEITYVLTRFERLGWRGDVTKKIPEIRNLSGVVNWQPQEGRLELDSEHTKIAVNGYPEQTLTLLNGALDWKELSDGLRVSVERFVLSKPNLTLSVQGAIDQVTRNSLGYIRLGAEFSGKNIEEWAPFLPKKLMKPKLYTWLTRDLKHIAELSGKITLNGMVQDFPFDNHNGEFTIISHANGGELYINPKWKKIKDIEGTIQLKNRNLNIDLVTADFQGVPIKYMNLRIDDIGKDKENLIIQGSMNAPVQKMVNYVMASPLKSKLKLLKQLTLKGTAQLNLTLQVPLYPENDKVLAKGDLTFNENTILVNYNFIKFTLNGLKGALFFNEDGVTDSALSATSLGHPLNIRIQSVKTPKPVTSIAVEGTWTVDSLKNYRQNFPIFEAFHGSFPVKAVLKLANKLSEADTIHLTSSLHGLAILLPAPLGKTSQDNTPFEMSVDLNPDKTLRLASNYDHRFSTDLLFKTTHGVFDLDSGQIRLGSANAVNQRASGLTVTGSLKGFDLTEWKRLYKQYAPAQNNSSMLFNKLKSIHVTLDKFSFLRQHFDAMSIKAKQIDTKNWSFNLQQKNIAADLLYHVTTNTLSGHIRRLHLDKLDAASVDAVEPSTRLTPNQIPNLDLRIDNLSIGMIQLGDMTLKSHSTSTQWVLNYCRIDSPFYQANVDGAWTQKKQINKTALHLQLTINNLANTLKRWNINPSVAAKKGYLEFKGGWNNDIANFSLASLNGDLFLQLKHGIITDLSQETEGKLDLGKLLSILSLQTIPRRLQLDFSDLARQGYSFDIFQGNFTINKGRMNTEDSYLDGPVAYASMKGDLDLVKRVYDLNLKISPHITASLPVVATIAGGPVAGVATWVATKIINQGMQKISAYSYKVSGPWKQPVVQQLSIIKKRNSPLPVGQGAIKVQPNLD